MRPVPNDGLLSHVRIEPPRLEAFVRDVLVAAGCSVDNACIMAASVVEADRRGHPIQGLDHLFSTVRDLSKGILDGSAMPDIAREGPATATLDGHRCLGPVGARSASDLAIAKAAKSGVAAIALLGAGDIFMLGLYASRIAEAGLVGIVFSNAWPPRVHPVGGIDRVLGTNPLAIGIPNDGDPVLVDMATSATAIGHVRMASHAAREIPPGLAIDSDGKPTTDPAAAIAGALSPFGAKGFGLGLCVALLSGPVIGAVLGDKLDLVAGLGDGDAGQRGHLFIALDPAAFGDSEAAKAGVRAYLDGIRASRRAPGVDRILIPGERAFESRRRNTQEVPIRSDVWSRTLAIALELGVEAPAVRG